MIAELFQYIVSVINYFGYTGIFILMVLESCAIPIPSEIVIPLAGYMTTLGIFSIAQVVATVTLANLVGSLILYYLGRKGRKFVF